MRPQVSLWLEGSHHPFDEIAEWFCNFLSAEGMEACRVCLDEALDGESDLVVLGGLVYSETIGYRQPAGLTERLEALRRRIPMLALHSVLGSWDDVPELDEFWDGRWNWENSRHSPIEPFQVKSCGGHSITDSLADFKTTDELYYNLRPPKTSRVLLEAEYWGVLWPLAWTAGNYVYCGLGHDVAALDHAPVRQFLLRTVHHLTAQKP
ncbi:hypothetical protein BH11ARM2_BH11ARM2_38420 [soil metagenome]